MLWLYKYNLHGNKTPNYVYVNNNELQRFQKHMFKILCLKEVNQHLYINELHTARRTTKHITTLTKCLRRQVALLTYFKQNSQR